MRNLMYNCLLTILFVLLAILSGCDDNETNTTEHSKTVDTVPLPDSEASGLRITLSNKGQVTTVIYTKQRREFPDSTVAYEVKVESYDSSGEITGHVVADSTVIHEPTGIFHLYDNVVLVTETGTRLETDYLLWYSKTDSIETTLHVNISRKDEWWESDGLWGNLKRESYRGKNTKGSMTNIKLLSEP
ncbi:MAG: LPS export ABC transporter periplasmic protein LptC [candidate division Zixibacteria bacterium]|nr:LPS export ABC transporter periplasmic protein LptC [candidate division Zixibacteria bacterium]